MTTTTTSTTTTTTTTMTTTALYKADEPMSHDTTVNVTDVVSDDKWSILNRNVNTTTKDSLKSPWKDELVERESDDSSSDTESNIGRASDSSTMVERISSTERFAGKYPMNVNLHARGGERDSRGRSVSTGRRKTQKYHWSGTFNARARKYATLGERSLNAHACRSLYEIVPDNANYNYNFEAFDNEKPAKKTKLFGCEKFNLECDETTTTTTRSKDRSNVRQGESRDGWKRTEDLRRNKSSLERRNGGSSLSECCKLLLTLVKNFLLFSLLPTVYVGFFVYVSRKQEQ